MELELASEGHQGAHEVGGAPRGAPPPSWTGCGPPGLHLLRGFFFIFSKVFHGVSGHSENLYFLHKNNTMAILLKTASVRVSSIQIIQVSVQNKGKSVWKSRYDGDVSRARPTDHLGCDANATGVLYTPYMCTAVF